MPIVDRRLPVLITLAVLILAAIACASSSASGEVTTLEDAVVKPAPTEAAIPLTPELPATEAPPTSLPEPTDEPEEQPPTEVPRPLTGYVIDEDFSEITDDWDIETRDTVSYGYYEGGYQVHVIVEDFMFYVVPNFDLDIADAIIDVDATRLGGTDLEMGAAVMCRVDPDTDSLYAFEVTFDGYFLISKYVDGTWVDIGEEWQTSDVINPDFNRIGVECLGNRLSLYVNNVPLRTIVDDELTSGTVAIAAASFPGKPDSNVLFDNLTVYVPEN
ncbi:MAG: hypothetical protein Kow00124_24110 [Anaerolineae bacterium]